MMYGGGKSDPGVVAVKPANNAEQSAAESVEPRTGTKGNADQQSTRQAQDWERVSQALARIRQAAKLRKKERFTSLLHHVSIDLLRFSFFALKKDAAPGVDGLAWRDYETRLEDNLQDLHARVHRGASRALPGRGQYIPKADGRQRPIAVCALEDKIVQRATATVLNAIYEEDFLGFSYGFRPKRSQHDALDALVVGITTTKVNWILEVDIRSFFDEVIREWLTRFVEHRIADPRILRLIQKWLTAGVLEDGVVTVAKNTLDASMSSCNNRVRARSFANSSDGWRHLLDWLTTQKIRRVHACMESTGRYSLGIACALYEFGHIVSIVNPAQIRDFARTKLGRNKTDGVDAAHIREYCELFEPEPWAPPSEAHRRLGELQTSRSGIVVGLTEWKNRKSSGMVDAVAQSLADVTISHFTSQLEAVDEAIAQTIDNDSGLRRKRDLLLSISGVGETLAGIVM